jgi:VanZ like protein
MVFMTAFRYVPIEALALAVLVGLVAAAGAALPALRRRERATAALNAGRVLLAGAVLAMLAVTMMRGAGETGVNLTPGAGVRTALSNVNSDLGLLNVLGNVVMFVPIGFLALLATRLRFGGVVASCLALSASVEIAQLTLGRSLDVDDVLLNTLGGVAGAAAGLAVLAVLAHGRRLGRLEVGSGAPQP